MQHRLVRRDGLGHSEATTQPLPGVPVPEQRRRQFVLTHHRPSLGRPPALFPVAAVLDERPVGAAGHRCGVDEEAGDLAPVRGALVVECPRLGRRTHGERTAGDQDFGRQGGRPGGPRRFRRVECGGARAQLMGNQHGFVMLLFVLGDHPEDESGPHQWPVAQRRGLQYVHCPAAHLRGVRTGLGGRQQRQRGTGGPGVLEGVVEAVDLRAHGLAAGDAAQQPQLFLVADVREVPDQGRHQRGVLGGEFAVVHAVGEECGALAGGEQRGERALPERLGVRDVRALRTVRRRCGGVGHERVPFGWAGPWRRSVVSSSRRSSAGHRPRAT